jgi:hypothetical protein
MRTELHTAWMGMDLVLTRADGQEVDRIPAAEIERVVLVCKGAGESPGDLVYAVIETPADAIVVPADSGIAGRVHFERQAFWAERKCIYWVSESQAALPRRLRPGLWMLRRSRPGYMRVPRSEVAAAIEQWPLEGPQTWEQRKWDRIVKRRMLTPLDPQAAPRQRSGNEPRK